MTTASPRSTVTRADWLVAGQELLREGGPDALRLAVLTERLGVTTGSFYHHWTDMSEFLIALADHYGAAQLQEGLAIAAHDDPAERLRRLATLAWDRRMTSLDRAMRTWAMSDRRAESAVRRTDRGLLEFVEQAFRDLGFERAEARVRALLLFSAGVASCYVPWSIARSDLDRMLEVVTAPGAARARAIRRSRARAPGTGAPARRIRERPRSR